MAEKMGIYKCMACGNIVEVLTAGDGDLFCCGEPMKKLVAKGAEEEGKEKHVPVIEKLEHGIKVKVGSVEHPMEEKHHIEWIEIVADGKAYRQFLNAGDKPEAIFCIDAENVTAKEHCNVHGLWKA